MQQKEDICIARGSLCTQQEIMGGSVACIHSLHACMHACMVVLSCRWICPYWRAIIMKLIHTHWCPHCIHLWFTRFALINGFYFFWVRRALESKLCLEEASKEIHIVQNPHEIWKWMELKRCKLLPLRLSEFFSGKFCSYGLRLNRWALQKMSSCMSNGIRKKGEIDRIQKET